LICVVICCSGVTVVWVGSVYGKHGDLWCSCGRQTWQQPWDFEATLL